MVNIWAIRALYIGEKRENLHRLLCAKRTILAEWCRIFFTNEWKSLTFSVDIFFQNHSLVSICVNLHSTGR